MDSTKPKISLLMVALVSIGLVFAVLSPRVAATSKPAGTSISESTGTSADASASGAQRPSEGQLAVISQNCATIRQSLEQLQYSDSRTRTYLGTTYEALANKFIIPLNLRLVKNNLPTLAVQSEFTLAQTKFKDSYTDYMRALGETMATDCKQEPAVFYERLETARARRAELHKWAERLDKLTDEHYAAVEQLIEELEDE